MMIVASRQRDNIIRNKISKLLIEKKLKTETKRMRHPHPAVIIMFILFVRIHLMRVLFYYDILLDVSI